MITLLYFAGESMAQNWTKLSAGSEFSMGIRSDGTLWGWGFNANGQLGLNSVTAVFDEPTQVGSDNDWVEVSAGAFHCLALKADGTLWAWGLNGQGQCGVGTADSYTSPQQVGNENNWMIIEAGQAHSLAIKNDGTLWGWGFNNAGQVGNGGNNNVDTPTQIGTASDWMDVAGGGAHSLGLRTNGDLYAWGFNFNGQLGTGNTNNFLSPEPVGSDDWIAVDAGFEFSVGLRADSSAYAWGFNANGQLGNGSTSDALAPTAINFSEKVAMISAGAAYALALNQQNELFAWGANIFGELGLGNTTMQTNPQLVSGADWWYVDAAEGAIVGSSVFGLHTLALRGDGNSVCVTGANYISQLGNGGTDDVDEFECNVGTDVVGTQDLQHLDLTLRPNPAREILHLQFTGTIPRLSQLEIHNLAGQTIRVIPYSDQTEEIEVSDLPQGMYILRLVDRDGAQWTQKFVKG